MTVKIMDYNQYYKLLNNKKNNEELTIIPLLIYDSNNKSVYNDYTYITQKIIKKMQNNILSNNGLPADFCQLECAIFLYMKQIVDNGKYSDIKITQVYDLMHYYNECSYKLTCSCKKYFQSDNNIKQEEYLKKIKEGIINHYNQVNNIKIIYEHYKQYVESNFPNESFAYLLNNPIKINIGEFNKTINIFMIAHSDNYVIYFINKPNFSKINYSDVLIEVLIKSYFIKKCDKVDDKNKFHRFLNKKIIACISCINSNKPVIYNMEIDDKWDIIYDYWRDYIHDKYKDYNLSVYRYCMEMREQRKSIDDIIKDLEKIKIPKYVDRYLHNIKSKYHQIKDSNKISDKQQCINKLYDQETFLNELNTELEMATITNSKNNDDLF